MAAPAFHYRLDSKLQRELGPVVIEALEAPGTEDIVLNADGRIWLKSRGPQFTFLGMMDKQRALGVINSVASMRGVVINRENPILETALPMLGGDADGSIGDYRITAIIPPVTEAPVIDIRVRSLDIYRMKDYRAAGMMVGGRVRRAERWRPAAGSDYCAVLERALLDRVNILVVGGPGAGKTKLLTMLLAEVAELLPDDRTVLIEDTRELQCTAQNFVALQSVDTRLCKVSMIDCLKAALRLRARRIVVGEVRGAEGHALLKAWNTGHRGGLATVHANDAAEGLSRLEALVEESPEARGPQQKLIAQAVDLVVFIEATENAAGRAVREMCLVRGWNEGKREYDVEYL